MIEGGFPNEAFDREDENDDRVFSVDDSYAGAWSPFARQGNPGSYRFMYDQDSRNCHAVPVPTPGALRDSIVATEERS